MASILPSRAWSRSARRKRWRGSASRSCWERIVCSRASSRRLPRLGKRDRHEEVASACAGHALDFCIGKSWSLGGGRSSTSSSTGERSCELSNFGRHPGHIAALCLRRLVQSVAGCHARGSGPARTVAQCQSAKTAQAAAGDAGKSSIMIVPQFLAEVDVEAHHLPPDTLRWTLDLLEGGEAALAPAPASSFEALDAILARLADRRLFPNLNQVVVAGHSGGAQVVQRYAIAGKGELALTSQGIGVRYVVANPSSYAYFNGERPEPSIAANCPDYNHWKYGME